MRELLELLEHDARRPVGEIAAVLKKSEYEVEKDIKGLEQGRNSAMTPSRRSSRSISHPNARSDSMPSPNASTVSRRCAPSIS